MEKKECEKISVYKKKKKTDYLSPKSSTDVLSLKKYKTIKKKKKSKLVSVYIYIYIWTYKKIKKKWIENLYLFAIKCTSVINEVCAYSIQ